MISFIIGVLVGAVAIIQKDNIKKIITKAIEYVKNKFRK